MRGAPLVLIVALLAVALRLPGLGSSPLSAEEARTAWSAFLLAEGFEPGRFSASPFDSGLLFTLEAGLFALLGAGDRLARTFPALAGVLLSVAPFAFRKRLGDAGALTAALLLAIDPWQIELSRTASGSSLTALLAIWLLFVASDGGWARLVVPAGLIAASGPDVWSFMPVLLLAAWIFRKEGELGEERSLRPFALAIAVAFLASSAALLYPAGVQSLSASLTAWIDRFTTTTVPGSLELLTSNPVLPALGLMGLLASLRDGSRFSRLLAVWAVWAWFLFAIGGAHERIGLGVVSAFAAARVGTAIHEFTRGRHLGRSRQAALVVSLTLLAMVLTARGARSERSPQVNEVRRLAHDVEVLGGPLQVRIEDEPDAVLAWYLRDVPLLRWVRAPGPDSQEGALLLVTGPSDDPPGAHYAGSRYRLHDAESVVLWAEAR